MGKMLERRSGSERRHGSAYSLTGAERRCGGEQRVAEFNEIFFSDADLEMPDKPLAKGAPHGEADMFQDAIDLQDRIWN